MKGEIAVVLGATSGIGLAVMEEFGVWGFHTVGFHRGNHEEAILPLQEKVREFACAMGVTQHSTFIKQDAGTYEGVIAGLNMLGPICNGPRVKVLVHSLAGAPIGPTMQMKPGYVEETFANQAHSFLWWVQGLVRRNLLADGARIIALSNPFADYYFKNTGVVGPAKAALEAYVRLLAVELRGKATVNGVRFAMAMTPSLRQMFGEKAAEALAPKMLTTKQVAEFVLMLCDTEAVTPMNGSVIDLSSELTTRLMELAFRAYC